MENEIFSDVRVIEIGQYIAAPVAAKLMSDMGAEVFKVELPPYGDMMRVYTPPSCRKAPRISATIAARRVCASTSSVPRVSRSSVNW